MDITRIPPDDELNQLLKNTTSPECRAGYITEKGFFVSEGYLQLKNEIENFEVFDTDLWICGFPKTGTTWASEISWLMVHDLDYEGTKELDYKRTRILEFSMIIDAKAANVFGAEDYMVDSINYTKNQKHPRTIKSHLPLPLLPKQLINGTKKPRIIYTARNPMDTCISYYYHCRNFEGFTGTFEEFCKLFLFDKVNYAPYAKHVLSFWEKRNEPNILFLTYEDMNKDLRGAIDKMAKLLGKTLSEDDVKRLQEHVSFDSMKKNPAVNKEGVIKMAETTKKEKLVPFIRNGKAGGYKNVMSPELINQFRYWMGKQFEGSGLNLLDN